jgi:hypothetical protein
MVGLDLEDELPQGMSLTKRMIIVVFPIGRPAAMDRDAPGTGPRDPTLSCPPPTSVGSTRLTAGVTGATLMIPDPGVSLACTGTK